MIDALKIAEARFEELEEMLAQPDIIADSARLNKLSREYGSLSPMVEGFREYNRKLTEISDTEQLLQDSGTDAELRQLCQTELQALRETVATLERELRIMLIPKDPNDEKNVIVEIRGGTGGDEAALFANSLYRMYSMYAEARRWQVELLNLSETELGGIKEVSFSISGAGAYSRLKYESGVHRVQRVPETESQGRIHTSTVTVAVLVEAEDVQIDIDQKDLKVDTFRSSGAGGQHINKTSSAIRITHLPTGTVVECQDERSQHKNRDKAMKLLRSRLYEAKLRERDEQIADNRKSQVGSGSRNERIRTYNYPQSRVTDHRIGLTLYRLDAVLNGKLDEVIDPLIAHDTAEKLAESGLEQSV